MNVKAAPTEVKTVYKKLINAWNQRHAHRMAELFADNGVNIGFDGSQTIGREALYSHVKPIFDDHPTPPFISKVKDVTVLSDHVVMLRAIAGMVPPGEKDLNPQLNTHHTLIVVKTANVWQIQLFQNTPAQFHGRPELVEEMTEELKELI